MDNQREAKVQPLRPQDRAIEGCLDAIADGKVFGWAWDRGRPADKLTVELVRDGVVVASGVADRRRTDLAASGIGDGAHAFEVELPEGVAAEGLSVAVRSAAGESTTLMVRPRAQLEQLPEELQRVNSTVLGLALAQKQGANAVLGALNDLQGSLAGSNPGGLGEKIAALATGQQALQKQLDAAEVFLMRFDGLLRQIDEKLDRRPAPMPRATILRAAAVCLVVVVAATVAVLIS